MISYPSSNDIYIEINGKKLAVAQGYRAKTSRESRFIEAFGSLEPVGTVGGRVKHVLELTRVCLTGSALDDGICFHDLENFNLVIAKPNHRIIYSGCQWGAIEETATLGNVVLESVSIVATNRLEASL